MLEYEIIYSKIKNVYIQIKEGMVIVKAPTKDKKDIKNNNSFNNCFYDCKFCYKYNRANN